MKVFLTTAAIFGVLAVAVALSPKAAAEELRLNNQEYTAGAHCLAYAQLPQLHNDPVSVDALADTMAAQAPYRHDELRQRLYYDGKDIAWRARSASPGALRHARDLACSQFAPSGLVQQESTTPAS